MGATGTKHVILREEPAPALARSQGRSLRVVTAEQNSRGKRGRGWKEHSGPGPQHMQRPASGSDQGIQEPKAGSVREEHSSGQHGPAGASCGTCS